MPEYTSWDATEDQTPLWEVFCDTPVGTKFQFTGDFGTQHGVHKGGGTLELQSLQGTYHLAIGDPSKGYISGSAGLPNVTKAQWEIVPPWEGALVVADRHGDVWVRTAEGLYSIPNKDGSLTGEDNFNEVTSFKVENSYGPCAVVLDSEGTYAEKAVDDGDDDDDDITECWSSQDLF